MKTDNNIPHTCQEEKQPFDVTNFAFQKIKKIYETAFHPSITITCQFIMWYVTVHTFYWSIEQLRFKWCVPCGFSGYFQSLVVNQSLVCKLLTETSKIMSNYQFNTITMLSSFVGLKCFPNLVNEPTQLNIGNDNQPKQEV